MKTLVDYLEKHLKTEAKESATHDYFTRRGWGHDYYIRKIIDGGQIIKGGGWGRGIKEGDYLLLNNQGNETRYQIIEIKYEKDPPDMWFATMKFAPQYD